MNIHRRDRARIRQQTPPSVSSRSGSDIAYSAFTPQPLQNHPSYHAVPPPTNYHHVPTSTSSLQHSKAFYGDNSGVRMPPQRLSLFGEDLNVGPSAQVQPAQVKDEEEEKKDWEDDELDLELRLGHEP